MSSNELGSPSGRALPAASRERAASSLALQALNSAIFGLALEEAASDPLRFHPGPAAAVGEALEVECLEAQSAAAFF